MGGSVLSGIPPGPLVLEVDDGCGLGHPAPSVPGCIGLVLAALGLRLGFRRSSQVKGRDVHAAQVGKRLDS
jgi:hypothetical protein